MLDIHSYVSIYNIQLNWVSIHQNIQLSDGYVTASTLDLMLFNFNILSFMIYCKQGI